MHQPPHQVVTKRGANHGLHVVLTILTCGLWAITGWPIAAAMGRKTKTTSYGPPVQQPYYPPPGQHQQPPYGQQPPPYYPPQQPQQQQPPGRWGGTP